MARIEITVPGERIVEEITALVQQPTLPSNVQPIKVGLVEISHVHPAETITGPPGVTYIGDTPPPKPINGRQWWKSNTGASFIWYEDGSSSQWIQTAPGTGAGGGGGGGDLNTAVGLTMDTGEQFRITMLANGTVTAVPYSAVPPAIPVGVAVNVRLSSVGISWSAAARATSYVIKRNGVQIGTTSNLSYRDPNITVGATYAYTVTSVDQYKQRSLGSTPVNAFIDIALNSAPIDVVIKVWPNPVPTDGFSYIRLNARDIDVQTVAYLLNVDAGSVTATEDPSVWILRI